jgi:hypothetical protein
VQCSPEPTCGWAGPSTVSQLLSLGELTWAGIFQCCWPHAVAISQTANLFPCLVSLLCGLARRPVSGIFQHSPMCKVHIHTYIQTTR